MSKPMIYGKKICDNKEEEFNQEHLFPRILGYMRGSDIKEGDIMEFRV